MATWIVGGILLLIAGAIIWKMIKDKRDGKGACACGGDCAHCCGCRSAQPSEAPAATVHEPRKAE